MIKYAGIGARDTPLPILEHMQQWAMFFARNGFFLRSGGARGADAAFETGHNIGLNGKLVNKRIYTAAEVHANGWQTWFDHAADFHPAWGKCTFWARCLHARNSPIVLGKYLNDPVNFVVCWTKGGKASGGTGQALRIAEANNIPIFNFYNHDANDKLRTFITELMAK